MEAAHERGAPAAWTIQAIAPPKGNSVQKMIDAFLKKGPRDLPSPIVTLDDKGTKWTDLIGTNNWNNRIDYIVTEEVLNTLNENRIANFCTRRVEFAAIPKKKLREQPRPAYFTLEPSPGVEARTRRMTNGEMDRSMPVLWREVIEPSVMEGADLIIGRHIAYCTIQFIELARANAWNNLKFYPVDSVRMRRIGQEMLEPLPVDYRGKQWPPARWYPDRHFELVSQCNQIG